MIIRRVQAEHKDMITKICLERDLKFSFYTIENEPQFLQLELNCESDQTVWFVAMSYGIEIMNEIHKSVYGSV